MRKSILFCFLIVLGIRYKAASQDSAMYNNRTLHKGFCFSADYTWQGTNFGGLGLCYYHGKSINYGVNGWKIDGSVNYGKLINPIWAGNLSFSVFELLGELRLSFKEFRSNGIIDNRITPAIYYSIIGAFGLGFGYNIPIETKTINGITRFELNFYISPPINSKFHLGRKLKYMKKMRIL